MKQLSFSIPNEHAFENAIDRVFACDAYEKATDVLAIAILGRQEPEYVERLIEIYKEREVKGTLCGYTAANALEYGICTKGGSNVTFFIFESGHADVRVYETEDMPEADCGANLDKCLKETQDAKALQIIPDIMHMRRLDDFLSAIHVPMDFPVVGASAGGQWEGAEYAPMFVFSDHVYKRGILTIVYSGKDLSVNSRVLMGWVPIGRVHTFTKLKSPTVVSEIDGLPATYIFRKYFNVEPDKYFYENTLGFPLYVKRNGEDMPRSIQLMDEEGNLIFASDIKEGENFYFSFGNISKMLQTSAEYASTLKDFAPQGTFLMICDYRFSYMGVDNQKEVDFFKNASPALCGGGAFGEFYNFNGRIENLNCSLVVLSLREGKKPKTAPAEAPEPLPNGIDGPVPLVDRLYSFLSETSNEYAALRSKERERNLRNAMEVERAANEEKSLFLTNISHEFRTPINAILGMDEMILRESGDEKILDYAEDIKAAGDGLLSLVNDILDFSKIQSGKLKIIPVEYSLSSLMNDLMNMITPGAQRKGLSVSAEYDTNTPDRLYGDVVRIKQVLVNILTNAVKFTEEGSVKFTITFVKTKRDEINLSFHVRDTGRGIKDEDLKKVYTPFERADEKEIRNIEGTGLGMSISSQLLKLMGSELEVESEYGKGSDFSFTIRQKVFSFEPVGDYFKKAQEAAFTQHANRETFHAPEAKILVVDDTEMNLTVVKNLLKRTQIQIDTATSGQESIDKAKETRYDIIFMDHRMPVMDGIEAMQHIRALSAGSPNEGTPIIALTASAVAGSRENSLGLGFSSYIPKPIDPDVLEGTIRKFLPEGKVITTIEDETDETVEKNGNLSDFLKGLISCKAIDITAGIAACGGTDTYEKVLTEFVKNASVNQKTIKADVKEEDYKDYTIRVHALKSSARLAGASDLSRHAAYLEQCGDALRTEEILKKTPALLTEYRRVVKAINNAMPREDDSEKELLASDMLKEGYQAIYESVSAFDFDGADNVMHEMKKYRVDDSEKDFFDQVDDLLTRVDHDGLVEVLGRLFEPQES